MDEENEFSKNLKINLDEEKILVPKTSSTKGNVLSSERSPKVRNHTKFVHKFSIGNAFSSLGRLIGSYPIIFCLIAVLLASSSLGMFKMKIQDRLRDGYTPSTSMSRYETDVYREFLGLAGDPIVTLVMFRAKDGASIHRLEHLDEVVKWHKFFQSNFSFDYMEDGVNSSKPIKYSDFCSSFCDANVAIEYFSETLKDELNRMNTGKSKSPNLNISYPITTVRGYQLHLERNFYGVKLEEENGFSKFNYSLKDNENLKKLDKITPIRYIEAAMLLFRGGGNEQKIAHWEMALYKFSQETFSSELLEMIIFGLEIIDYEMKQNSPTSYFALGFSAMLVFVFINVLSSSYFYGVLDGGKIWLVLVATLCPVLAITSTFGIFSLIHMRINTIMLIMPFLIMGIGVDDAFLMIHSWLRTAKHKIPIIERIALTLEEIGPSITITTITNVLTFSIGYFTPTPEIQLFCLATATALGLTYVYCIILFVPAMYFASVYEEKKEVSASKNAFKIKSFLSSTCDIYTQILEHRLVALVLFLSMLAYWYFAIVGTLTINSKIDPEKLLPHNSKVRKAEKTMSSLVYYEYYPITVLINNPFDIRKNKDLHQFENMLGEFESNRWCRGKDLTILWLRDYINYIKTYEDFDYYSEDGEPNTSLSQPNETETGLDYKRLKEFLYSPVYKHHAPFLRLNENNPDFPLSKFMFIIANYNTTTWSDRIEIVQQSRAIAAKYPNLNVTIWEANSMFVDQMLSLKKLTLMTCLMTLGCMAIVCGVFIRNLMAVIFATMAILSVSLGVIGYLSWWEMDLDPATMCAILMSIGLSVDFTAHMSYKFQLIDYAKIQDGKIVKIPLSSQHDKLVHAIKSVGWPMVQGGISTIITILPLALLKDYIPMVFVKTITLVVILGIGHGMLLLPAFMVLFPQTWFQREYQSVSARTATSKMEEDIRIEELKKDIM